MVGGAIFCKTKSTRTSTNKQPAERTVCFVTVFCHYRYGALVCRNKNACDGARFLNMFVLRFGKLKVFKTNNPCFGNPPPSYPHRGFMVFGMCLVVFLVVRGSRCEAHVTSYVQDRAIDMLWSPIPVREPCACTQKTLAC